jgi:hypothetical protein
MDMKRQLSQLTGGAKPLMMDAVLWQPSARCARSGQAENQGHALPKSLIVNPGSELES